MNAENRYQPPKADVADVAHDSDELASRWARLGGAIVDGLIMAAVLFPIMFSTGYWQRAMESAGSIQIAEQLQWLGLSLLIQLAINGYLLHKYGQSVGKWIAGTRIVSVDDNRILPLWRVYALRYLPISFVSQIPVVGGLVGFIDPLFIFRDDKRCLHDLIAGTKVVKSTVEWHGPHDAANS